MFEAEKKEVNYLNKGFDKVVVNFVGIKTVCIKYNISFSSKFKLHKHLKAGYVEIIQALFFLLTCSILPIFIIKSKSIPEFLGSGLIF